MDGVDHSTGNDAQVDASQENQKKNIKWVVPFVIAASMALICMGFFLSITGPTLQFLALNTDSTISQVSILLSGRAVGGCLGALVYSAIASRFQKLLPLLSSGFAMLIMGLVLLCTPLVHSVALLIFLQTTAGLMFGYSEACLQGTYLRKWGDCASRPFIQLHHFSFGLGAFITPFIAKPFLEMASQEELLSKTCPSENSTSLANDSISFYNNITDDNSSSPINSAFYVIGGSTMLVALFMCVLGALKIEDRISGCARVQVESRPEGSIKDLWILVVAVIMYMFCCVGSENAYQAFIYAVSTCSALKMDATKASLLNGLFWAGFGIGRASGIFTSRYFKPSTIITIDLIGTTSAMIVMCIWGERSREVTWTVTFAYGLFVASLLPSVGGNFGSSVLLPAEGVVFETNPFSVMYVITGTCVANIAFYVMMQIAGRKVKESNPVDR